MADTAVIVPFEGDLTLMVPGLTLQLVVRKVTLTAWAIKPDGQRVKVVEGLVPRRGDGYDEIFEALSGLDIILGEEQRNVICAFIEATRP